MLENKHIFCKSLKNTFYHSDISTIHFIFLTTSVIGISLRYLLDITHYVISKKDQKVIQINCLRKKVL